jgi:outer membrane protein OmpA-like peptidoglycan-associated protein
LAEEAYLENKFGADYRQYCGRTPRWLPGWRDLPARFKTATEGMAFNFRRVLAKDYSTIALTALLLLATETYRYLAVDNFAAASTYVPVLLVGVSLAVVFLVVVRTMKKRRLLAALVAGFALAATPAFAQSTVKPATDKPAAVKPPAKPTAATTPTKPAADKPAVAKPNGGAPSSAAAGAAKAGTAPVKPALPMSLAFAADSAELLDNDKQRLDQLAAALAGNDKRLQLLAYARAEGSDATFAARRLSLARALAVRSYLLEKGIRSNRIDVRALGTPTQGEPGDRVDVQPSGG